MGDHRLLVLGSSTLHLNFCRFILFCLTSFTYYNQAIALAGSVHHVWLLVSSRQGRKKHVVQSPDDEGMDDATEWLDTKLKPASQFMRRAAASKDAASKDSQSTSDSSKPHSKRPRLSTDAESARASEMDAITAALAAEEEKRQKAVARAAEEAGETHWVLDMPSTPQYKPQPLVLAADSLDADDDNHSGGRQTFGNFKRKEKVGHSSHNHELSY